MTTDTAGNIIQENLYPCPNRCGSTGGCSYCRPIPFLQPPPMIDYEEDTITKEEKARVYKKTMKSSI